MREPLKDLTKEQIKLIENSIKVGLPEERIETIIMNYRLNNAFISQFDNGASITYDGVKISASNYDGSKRNHPNIYEFSVSKDGKVSYFELDICNPSIMKAFERELDGAVAKLFMPNMKQENKSQIVPISHKKKTASIESEIGH